MTEAQLHPAAAVDIEDPDDGKRNRSQVGIENVLQHLEASLGQQKPVQRARPSRSSSSRLNITDEE
eukprot:7721904-Pyramimonas_sp.AAC.1